MSTYSVIAGIVLACLLLARRLANAGALRPKEPGFRYVYINSDGSVRELSRSEKESFTKKYAFGDTERPYGKDRYDQRDGWGSVSGFIERKRVPASIVIGPVDPDYVRAPFTRELIREMHEYAGFKVTDSPGGLTVQKDPNSQVNEKHLFTEIYLAHGRAEEEKAKPKH